jgi:hypothetical protein
MRDRWEQAPAAARLRGHDGNRRLHQRWQTFNARKKKPVIADVAIARELVGWAWLWPYSTRNPESDPVFFARHPLRLPREERPASKREQPSSPPENGRVRSLDQRLRSSRTARPAVNNREYQSDRASQDTPTQGQGCSKERRSGLRAARRPDRLRRLDLGQLLPAGTRSLTVVNLSLQHPAAHRRLPHAEVPPRIAEVARWWPCPAQLPVLPRQVAPRQERGRSRGAVAHEVSTP